MNENRFSLQVRRKTGGHVYCTLFANGANAGALTLRHKEYDALSLLINAPIRECIKAISAGERQEDGSFIQRFGPAFLQYLKQGEGDE